MTKVAYRGWNLKTEPFKDGFVWYAFRRRVRGIGGARKIFETEDQATADAKRWVDETKTAEVAK